MSAIHAFLPECTCLPHTCRFFSSCGGFSVLVPVLSTCIGLEARELVTSRRGSESMTGQPSMSPLQELSSPAPWSPHGQHFVGTCMQCFAFVCRGQGRVTHLKVRSLAVLGLILCLLARVYPLIYPPLRQSRAGGLFSRAFVITRFASWLSSAQCFYVV